jgi:hypothetical protein
MLRLIELSDTLSALTRKVGCGSAADVDVAIGVRIDVASVFPVGSTNVGGEGHTIELLRQNRPGENQGEKETPCGERRPTPFHLFFPCLTFGRRAARMNLGPQLAVVLHAIARVSVFILKWTTAGCSCQRAGPSDWPVY